MVVGEVVVDARVTVAKGIMHRRTHECCRLHMRKETLVITATVIRNIMNESDIVPCCDGLAFISSNFCCKMSRSTVLARPV